MGLFYIAQSLERKPKVSVAQTPSPGPVKGPGGLVPSANSTVEPKWPTVCRDSCQPHCEAAAELERRLGVPVVTANQATIWATFWATFRKLGLNEPIRPVHDEHAPTGAGAAPGRYP